MARYRERFLDVLPVALLVISVPIFFSQVIWSGKPLFGSDFVLYFYPVKKFIRDYVLSHGTIPLWNPYQFSGTPLIANIQASMFYPLGFLFYLMPTQQAFGYTIIIHWALGAIFMYAFVRSLRISRSGAFIAALIFDYNGFFVAHLYAGHLTFVQNYIWIPLILFFVYRFIDTTDFRWALCAGLSLGIQILGGFPQIAFYTILTILALTVFYTTISLKARRAKDVVIIGLGLAVVVCIGFSVAAVQLLPSLEFTRLSGRAGGVSYWFATFDSLHPKKLISFLIPDFFGNLVDGTYWLISKGWTFWETCGYVGILPLCFIFASVPSTRQLRRTRYFFTGLIIVALLLALGKYNPLYPLVYKLPGFNSFRIPAQILFLYVFAVAVLSGIALNHMQQSSLKLTKSLTAFLVLGGFVFLFLMITIQFFSYDFFYHLFKTFAEEPIDLASIEAVADKIGFAVNRSALLFFAAVLLLTLYHKKRISKPLFNVLVMTMIISDLGLYSAQFVKSHEFITSKEQQEVINQLQDELEAGGTLTSNSIFRPNDGLLYRFPSIGGYDPLILKRYILYLQASQQLPPERHVLGTSFVKDHSHKFLKMLHLKRAVWGKGVATLDDFVPRAIVVGKAIVKPAEEVLDFMMTDAFDPLRIVVLEPESEQFMLPDAEADSLEGFCSIVHYDHENIRIMTSANQACYLVLSEIFYPGWKAKIDGNEAPILCGNYIFRVIPLEHGEHEVELRFVSRPFRIGAIISLLTLICSGGLGVFGRRYLNRLPKGQE
jgi:hypothetical protein